MFRKVLAILFVLILSFSAPALQNDGDLTITILYDNYQYAEGLPVGWGFSCIVEGADQTILFDIGSGIVPSTMKKLGIDPGIVDTAVFSHDHQDHTIGTLTFLRENSEIKVYLPQSFSKSFKDSAIDSGAECLDVSEPVEICEGIHSTGELGTWPREQALAIKISGGLVVITGCAHPGIIQIVEKAKEVLKEDHVYLAMGGFHLLQMGNQQIKDIIAKLRSENVKKVAPTHCTGDNAIALFKAEYGDDFISVGVGKEIKIQGAFPQFQGTAVDQRTKVVAWAQIKCDY